jgi:phage terminase large subunit GpA-like protein
VRDAIALRHFPKDRDFFWFMGLVSERPVRKYHRGVPRIEWIVDTGVRNEPLDCRVYASAALSGLYTAGLVLSEAARRVVEAADRGRDDMNPPSPKQSRVIRSGWMR